MTKRVLKGKVVSSKSNKTVVVEVIRKFQHPFYGKVISKTKKYHAHDENNKFKEGDVQQLASLNSRGVAASIYICIYGYRQIDKKSIISVY